MLLASAMHTTLPLLLVGTPWQDPRAPRALAELPARIVFPPDLGLDLDPEEGETSFLANAKLKARAYGAPAA